LANAIENYTAFAFARAFLIIKLFVVWGLAFGVYCLGFRVWDTFNSFCQENFASLLPCELCAKQKSSRDWEFSSADVGVFTNHQSVRGMFKRKEVW
jgi:hypothetical protein